MKTIKNEQELNKKEIDKIVQKIREQVSKIGIPEMKNYSNYNSDKKIAIEIPIKMLPLIEIPEDETPAWKHGYEEGNICGQQVMLEKIIYMFLNSETAYNCKITGMKAEIDENGNYCVYWNFGKRPKKLKDKDFLQND